MIESTNHSNALAEVGPPSVTTHPPGFGPAMTDARLASVVGASVTSWFRPHVPAITLIRLSSVAPSPSAIAGPSA